MASPRRLPLFRGSRRGAAPHVATTALVAALCLVTAVGAGAPQRLRLATTTSAENSGLLGSILPHFSAQTGLTVDVIAVGSGKALKLGENGDVDVLLTHVPVLEAAFVAKGYGVNRRELMYNDFVVIGPRDDPLALRDLADAAAVFGKIAAARATFISRGDESGTHQKEKEIWRRAAVQPAPPWYLSAGLGMGKVLMMADEKRAYTLSDRGTFLAYRRRGDLAIVYAGDPALYNPYSVMAVNPARHRGVNYLGAMRLIAWLTSPEGQKDIAALRIDGQPLFIPLAVPPRAGE